MIILDSDHREEHVLREEMELYAPLVTPGSFLLVQNGMIDTLELVRIERPASLPAIRRFLAQHPEFEVAGAVRAGPTTW